MTEGGLEEQRWAVHFWSKGPQRRQSKRVSQPRARKTQNLQVGQSEYQVKRHTPQKKREDGQTLVTAAPFSSEIDGHARMPAHYHECELRTHVDHIIPCISRLHWVSLSAGSWVSLFVVIFGGSRGLCLGSRLARVLHGFRMPLLS